MPPLLLLLYCRLGADVRVAFLGCFRLLFASHLFVFFPQYDVSDFAFGVGLIDAGQRRALKKKEEECLKSIDAGKYK